MKWVVVFLIIVLVVVACGDVVDGDDSSFADLEARIVRIEEALSSEPLPEPWSPESQRQGLIDVSDLEWQVDMLKDRIFALEMGWR